MLIVHINFHTNNNNNIHYEIFILFTRALVLAILHEIMQLNKIMQSFYEPNFKILSVSIRSKQGIVLIV